MNNVSRIGGKGTIRRKKKRHIPINKQNIKKNPLEIRYFNIIISINKKILSLDKGEYDIFLSYIDSYHNDFLIEINKKDFNKKDMFLKFRDDPFLFFDTVFLKVADRLQYSNNLINLYKYFKRDILGFIINLYSDILNILEKKEFLMETEAITEEFNNITLSESYNYFDIKLSQEITSTELKQIYRKKALKIHPDKNPKEKEKYTKEFKQMNTYYKYILNRMNK